MPVGLFRDGKKRKRRAAARARAAEAGRYVDNRARPDPLVTNVTYVAAAPQSEGLPREPDDFLSANTARGRY